MNTFRRFRERLNRIPLWIFILAWLLSGALFAWTNLPQAEVRGVKDENVVPEKEVEAIEEKEKETSLLPISTNEETESSSVAVNSFSSNSDNPTVEQEEDDSDDSDKKKKKKKKKKSKKKTSSNEPIVDPVDTPEESPTDPVDPIEPPTDPVDPIEPPTEPPVDPIDPPVEPPTCDASDPYLYVNGSIIEDSCGNEFQFHGVNWFGFETPNATLHGLWTVTMDDLLNVVEDNGFNALRVPLSIPNIQNDPMPTTINYWANKDLQGKSSLEVMDVFVGKACERNLKVMFDIHRLDNYVMNSELWYLNEPGMEEADVILAMQKLVTRYKDSECVIAFDLMNEPHGSVTYGDGNEKTDWKIGAQRLAAGVLEANPNLLIFVEGIDGEYSQYGAFWGESFDHGYDFDIRKDKLVYSPHVYGPSVYNQVYFNDPSFPNNMPEIWDYHFGYIKNQGIGPIAIGEFGGRYTGDDKVWQDKFVDYLIERDISSFFYWSLNPNSADTGGILKDDWRTLEQEKVDLLQRLMQSLAQ